ncbi:MAG: sulfate permease, partial [Bacteroidetes bacterium]
MMGFVNGLAIVIFLAQIGMFKKIDTDFYGNKAVKTISTTQLYKVENDKVFDLKTNTLLFTKNDNKLIGTDNNVKYEIHGSQIFDANSKKVAFNISDNKIYDVKTIGFAKSFLDKENLLMMLLLVGLTMLIMWGLPKIKLTSKSPSALVAIIVVSTIVILGGFKDVATVGSFIRDGGGKGLAGSIPLPRWETFTKIPLNWETFKFILPYSLICAAVGLIESLMTLNLIDDLTETRGNANRECLAQGGANIITGLFGGMGGCAMIGQSIINIKGGGRGRLSGIVAAVMLLMFILFGSSYIERIPIAALVGVMFMVVIGTFAWSSFRIWRKIPRADLIVLILVSALTVIFDLAIAVFAGVIVSALVFAWENASRIRARKRVKEDGTKIYEIW